MIPPLKGEMAGPPSWYDQVIDLTLDEAEGLMEMGVEVLFDCCHSGGNFTWDPVPSLARASIPSQIRQAGHETRIYYIPKEPAHDSSQ